MLIPIRANVRPKEEQVSGNSDDTAGFCPCVSHLEASFPKVDCPLSELDEGTKVKRGR